MKEEKLHKHGGKSSEAHLDPHRVLESIKLKEGDNFMDAGCGNGYISLVATQIVKPEGWVFAVDTYQESLDILSKKVEEDQLKNISVIKADLTEKIPLDDDLVDLCMMANVFHGFVFNNEVNQPLSEIKRTLKSGGRFALIEFKKIENTPGPSLNHRVDAREVKNIVQEYGLTFLEELEVGPHHYAVIFKAE